MPAIALLLAIAAIATTVSLQRQAESDGQARLQLESVKVALARLQMAPFQAAPASGDSPKIARRLIRQEQAEISGILADLRSESHEVLSSLPPILARDYASINRTLVLGSRNRGSDAEADRLAGKTAALSAEANGVLDRAAREYETHGDRASVGAVLGRAIVILLLLAAFAFYYRRSARVSQQVRRLLAKTHQESITDDLTGLNNRRALMDDLEAEFMTANGDTKLMLSLYDLDGFKKYNDTFGHPAGDALLTRLGHRLRAAAEGNGRVYRMGGDEFCLLACVADGGEELLAQRGNAALSESGQGFEVSCSHGIAILPAEAATAEQALRVSDKRMYATKAASSSASRQTADVLLQVLSERSVELGDHLNAVAALTDPVAKRLGISEPEVKRIRTAAELHDVGKSGIPMEILDNRGPLDSEEWDYIKRHTTIGERILQAAPALAPCADLVRSCHEGFDGSGYPDGLAGDAIPIGSRIIAACDAFDAMTSERPYREPVSVADALSELCRCAGTQFDPEVVATLCAVIRERSDDSPRPTPPLAASA